jgi:hypothetical protein
MADRAVAAAGRKGPAKEAMPPKLLLKVATAMDLQEHPTPQVMAAAEEEPEERQRTATVALEEPAPLQEVRWPTAAAAAEPVI